MSDQASNPGYSLYAVLVHSGHSVNSGHYFSYVKSSSGQWHLMDDSSVRQVGVQHVLEQRAYILFYVRTELETLPIAAPSPGVSPAMGPAQVGIGASKIAQLNLEAAALAAAKKIAKSPVPSSTAPLASAAATAAAAAAAATAAANALNTKRSSPMQVSDGDSDEGDSDEGDSDEGDSDKDEEEEEQESSSEEEEEAARPKKQVQKPKAKKTIVLPDSDEEDAAMSDIEDDLDRDEDGDAAPPSDDDAAAMPYLLSNPHVARMRELQRINLSRAYRMNTFSLHLQPGAFGQPHRFSAIRADLRFRTTPTIRGEIQRSHKRRRIHIEEDDEEGEEEEQEEAAPQPKRSPAPTAAVAVKEDKSSKKQKTEVPAASPSAAAANVKVKSPAAPAAAPALPPQPVWFNETNTPPAASSAPTATASSVITFRSASSAAAAAAAASPATPKSVASPSTPVAAAVSAPAPTPVRSGPIIVSREAFDPRKLQRTFADTQFGTTVGDWDTLAQGDTSAKYMMKRQQDKANAKLVQPQKQKDQWDEELDKGHVRKTKTGKSTALSADGHGAAGSNMFQMAQNNRNTKKSDERNGVASPGGRGGAGGDKSRGAQRGFKAKGFTTHKERNQKAKGGKGGKPKGPRDFSA